MPSPPCHPITCTCLAALLATLAIATPDSAASAPAALDLHGTQLRADCSADAWPAAQAELSRAAGGRDAASLATLLRAYLCDDGTAAAALVLRHAPARLLQRGEGTGEAPSRRRVAAAEALAPRGGRVYGLQVGRTAPDRIALHWQADEACVHGVTLAHRAGAWSFVETGSACD